MDDSYPRSSTGGSTGGQKLQGQDQDQAAAYGGAGIQGTASGTEQGIGQQAGTGTMGSGVAGGHEGSQQSGQAKQQQQEKQDWLDKGIQSMGKKMGFNVSNQNADKAGDLANKQLKEREGRNIPGVQ